MAFRLPTQVVLQPGSMARVPEIVSEVGQRPVLLVYDAGLAETPWPSRLQEVLAAQGTEVIPFDGVENNPRHTTVDSLADEARNASVGCVVGLGGGSVLDAAKAVAMLLRNPGSCVDYEGRNRYRQPPAPFIAVPTTCGTGSEVTWVSVITHKGQQRKMSIKGEAMFPTYAVVDADLLATLPRHLVAYTGVDALTHALEAYTGTAANPASDALAEKVVYLLLTYLCRAAEDIAGDEEAREAVMQASTLAGIAFGNADVAAVHCLSETIGGIWDVPHGLANAMLLVPVLRYHLPFARARLATLAGRVGLAGAEEVVAAVERLTIGLNIPPFASLGVESRHYARIADGAVRNNSNGSNPQPMGEENYLDILRTL